MKKKLEQPVPPGPGWKEQALNFSDELLIEQAGVVWDLLVRMTSRWKRRRHVETDWPVVPLATYGLVLEDELKARGFTCRRKAIIVKVARLMNRDEESTEAILHEDLIRAMGTMPAFLQDLEAW